MGGRDPSPDQAAEGTKVDVEIVEEGEEAETTSPAWYGAKGRPNLFLATYRLGRSRVTEEELDEYIGHGLIKASLCSLCRAPGQEEVANLEPYEAITFHYLFEAVLRFPCEDFVGEVL